ncbi:hypothetical protein GCM10020367_39100 [Streptomyces sannanensis]|uniref:HTH cro/C1-type domain-containing protein n=1 Tax=Streptomyces sannanensis TaxID=285536 RepID=A0ABP6SER5_9ACTN
MPRWKALPEELDPQVREFASQLRRLVDRSGLSISAVADRTGYSKTSWERYLNGRLLAPKGAIIALADVTGTNPAHLATMWELAERAWSRSEMRHDMTMQAIRISEARAALGEFGPTPAAKNGKVRPAAGASGTVAPPGTGHGQDRGYSAQPPSAGGPSDSGGGRRRATMFLAGIVGALLLIAAAVLLLDLGGQDGGKTANEKPPVSPTTAAPELPAGVKCAGADCAGQDPETMGCGGQFATTTSRVKVGAALVEVRYSKTCGAAWARITQATPGDKVTISGGAGAAQAGTVDADNDAYTPMVAAADAGTAKACATLTTGVKGCTTQQ